LTSFSFAVYNLVMSDTTPGQLKQHQITLAGQTGRDVKVQLRPLIEHDWDFLEKWNRDPDVLYYTEGDDVTAYSPEKVRQIYRSVSQRAYCFLIEADGKAIGECWLQQMNLPRVLRMHPGLDCRRIDLMIGEKEYWSQGIGTVAIRLLTGYAFINEKADIIYNPDIADYNSRSLKAFQKAGYRIVGETAQAAGAKSQKAYDLALTRDEYLKK
jgi:aminoglycoside 6'-N-acetyltransferase